MKTKLATGPRAQSLMFWCPGCEMPHGPQVSGGRWSWNGDREKPTLSPSLLVTCAGDGSRCHSFIRDGKIQFLGDCTHMLKGQTVEIPEWPYAEGTYHGVDEDPSQ